MLKRLLDGTDLAQLRDMVSPAFFDVLPARELWRQGRHLAARYRDERAYGEALSHRADSLRAAGLGVHIGVVEPHESEAIDDPTARGEALLRLYFHQVLTPGPALIDLRRQRFAKRGDGYVFDPSRITVNWAPDFRMAVRAMYEGFYRGNDRQFVAALESLGLGSAVQTFREQFGGGDQRAVRFEMKAFVGSFHEAFVACREAGDTLHPNFLGLGITLAFLYDHLESLGGGPFDVRSAYFAAAGEPVADAA
ncbi:MAG: hypothetical protein JJ863_08420 [Deltaproteobacteria bacterium]|nr:hypothetical protein [Deltaproteobacteria bacterium]